MSRTVVITGGIASGKTTLAEAFRLYGYKKLITYTTRDKRPFERHGVDYNFISECEFQMRVRDNFFAETTVYGAGRYNHLYGSSREDYQTDIPKVIVLNPQGVASLDEDAFVIFLKPDDEEIMRRVKKRGDFIQNVHQRIEDDALYLEEMLTVMKPDLTITANTMDDDMLFEIVTFVGGIIEARHVNRREANVKKG